MNAAPKQTEQLSLYASRAAMAPGGVARPVGGDAGADAGNDARREEIRRRVGRAVEQIRGMGRSNGWS